MIKAINLGSVRGRSAAVFISALLLANAGNAYAEGHTAWLVDGRPSAEAKQALAILQSARTDGLNPADYQVDMLARALGEAGAAAPLPGPEQAKLAQALSASMERYVSDLHFGRINPREVHSAFAVPTKPLDPASYVAEAVAGHTLAEAMRAAAPQLPLYAGLRQALLQYRALEANPALQQPLPAPAGNKLEPGQAYAGAADLARRLGALGDMPADAKVGAQYRDALVDGVKAFQLRHGLTPDGVVGKGTLVQLNTPPAARVRQIELTLERLRWTPLLLGERMIVVNVPEFVLRAYEVKDGGAHLRMNVIVGKSLDTRTPLFVKDMLNIEFSPYWNIPPSIAKAETVPRLRRDPAHFTKQGLEFVTGAGTTVPQLSAANLDAVMRGELRIRQRPGPLNALGDIKFIFPNSDNIYLHHTPAVPLFKRDRRDLSHGCIRVEDPVALAKFVLQDQPEWTEQRIREAMTSGKSQTMRLKHPLPVVIAYGTVIAKNNGKVYFFNDIYGNDKLLDSALKTKENARRGTPKAS